MAKEIINQLETALGDTLSLLDYFNEKEMNTISFEGSWTAAQVFRHLFKSENGMDELLYAPTEPVERRPDEKVDWLKDTFLNFEVKFESPDFIIPEDKNYNKEELSGPLKEVADKMIEAAKKVNLSEIAPLSEGHPFEGSTKLEMIHFITYHTIRHNRQLRRIREKV
jgi:hypothetical protein